MFYRSPGPCMLQPLHLKHLGHPCVVTQEYHILYHVTLMPCKCPVGNASLPSICVLPRFLEGMDDSSLHSNWTPYEILPYIIQYCTVRWGASSSHAPRFPTCWATCNAAAISAKPYRSGGISLPVRIQLFYLVTKFSISILIPWDEHWGVPIHCQP